MIKSLRNHSSTRRRRVSLTSARQRDNTYIAPVSTAGLSYEQKDLIDALTTSPTYAYTDLSDGRRWTPLSSDYPLNELTTLTGAQNAYTVPARTSLPYLPYNNRFSSPDNTLICLRRLNRRASLFAAQRIGNGKRVSNRRRQRWTSNINCT